jgi:small subunit ribosomal protein S5
MDKNLKKTADAYGTVSEEKALKKAKEIENTTQEMIEKRIKKEKAIEIEQEEMLLKEIDKENKKALSKTSEEEKDNVKKTFKDAKNTSAESWEPKTKLGKDVKSGKIKNIDEILNSNQRILEEKIVDYLVEIKSDLISIGQAKGKFGGGKRRAWRQTQRKTQEGNKLTFSAMAVVGDENGHIGFGVGKATETLPARDKAIRKAKLNMIKVQRACSSFDCSCSDPHSIPFQVEGKAGSVSITLIPAPQGTGLVVAGELKKVLKLAGIKDIYSKSFGKKRTSFNLIKACINALKKTNKYVEENKK